MRCDGNQFDIELNNGTFDLSTLSGFDVSKASEWTNATVDGTTLTVTDSSNTVAYTYDCGNNKSVIFTLVPVTEKTSDIKGDIDSDGKVTSADALMVLQMVVDSVEKNSAADLDGDGIITSNDALVILRTIVGLE